MNPEFISMFNNDIDTRVVRGFGSDIFNSQGASWLAIGDSQMKGTVDFEAIAAYDFVVLFG